MNMKKMNTPLLLALAALTTLALSGCTGGDASADSASTAEVAMKDVMFTPATLTVKAGTTVTWTNEDANIIHTVTAEDGSFDSGEMNTGETFSHTFTKAGTYYYYCVPHATEGSNGHMTGMTGKIIVE